MICTSLILGLHLATYHFNRDTTYQEFNPGIYTTCDSWTGGIYYNSENRTSIYLGKTWETQNKHFALTLGGVTGYKAYSLAPILVPSAKLGPVRLSLLLPLEKKSGGIHLSLEKTWK